MLEELPSGWTTASLNELGTIGRGRSRHRPRHDPILYGGKYPFVQTGDVKAASGRLTTFSQTYNEVGLAQSKLWPKGTLCITIAANIAETALLDFSACFPDSVVGFVPDLSKADVRFAHYAMGLVRSDIHHQVGGTGSAQDNINIDFLERLQLPVPPLPEQKAIAAILGALDDKIDLNRQMNRTLEEMTSALFKSWFIDFDPVTAKLEGRQPFGMDVATAALFPAEFEDGRPKGWPLTPINEVAAFVRGRSYTSNELSDAAAVALVSLKSFTRGGGYRRDGLKGYTGKFKPEQVVQPGEVVVAVTDVTQQAEVIGRAAIVTGDRRFDRLVGSLDTMIARPGNEGNKLFLYHHLRSTDWVDHVLGYTNGTTVLHLDTKCFEDYSVPMPSDGVTAAFNLRAGPMHDLAAKNTDECDSLVALRDLLLPQLLSGEIRIKDAEKLVEAAL